MMEIDSNLILESQKLLLPDGCEFDEERIDFITNLESMDLVAVPGSGKTTALQAKLYCLAKSLPFDDGSGILVLSHTNAAVEEVKKKLSFNTPQLFSYPCAVVTVQEFVDRFLALPFYTSSKKISVTAIDGARYNEAVRKYMLKREKDFVWNIFNQSDARSNPFYKARFFYRGDKVIIVENVEGKEITIPMPPTWKKTADEKRLYTVKVIEEMKKDLLNQGILHYDDCYFLAKAYLSVHPGVKKYIRKRFPFVFVDETQDLKKYQLDIIDDVFNTSEVVLQRIGDHNQSIFSNGSEGVCEWMPRNVRTLTNSLRLSDAIAKVVNPFMLNKTDESGKIKFLVNGAQPNSLNLPPVLILYGDEHTGEQLKECFISLITEAGLDKHKDSKLGFYIVGWNASYPDESKDERKPRLEDVFPDFKHRSASRMNFRSSLSDYLNFIDVNSSPKEVKDELLAAICRAISLSGANNKILYGGREVEKHYTPSTYIAKAKENTDTAILFDAVIYDAVSHLRDGSKGDAYEVLKKYIVEKAIPLVSGVVNSGVTTFLGIAYENNVIMLKVLEDEDDALPITISTVHSAKGQTHCATMYVETSFWKKYETEWLIEQRTPSKRDPSTIKPSPFMGDDYSPHTDSAQKAMKMLYVGFSRPKHLLCYASNESLWTNDMLDKMESMGWRVIHVKEYLKINNPAG